MKVPIKKAIRNASKRTHITNRKCYVCGEKLVQNHHILKVASLATLLMNNRRLGVDDIPIPTEDLCPNHHTKTHILYGDMTGDMDLNRQESDKIYEMVESTLYIPVDDIFDQQVAYQFNNIIKDTILTVENNIENYFNKELE